MQQARNNHTMIACFTNNQHVIKKENNKRTCTKTYRKEKSQQNSNHNIIVHKHTW